MCGPLLILVLFAAPAVPFLLPATRDHLGEIYQPVQALKFFQSHGRAYHKYGPMENFILAPSYALSLAWWKVTGSFRAAGEKFPYGFAKPFDQIGSLILQSRVIFLALGVGLLACFARSMEVVTRDRRAIALAMTFCLATNAVVIGLLPSARPDSPMIAFAAATLACYLRLVCVGPTRRVSIGLGLFFACAVTSKEFAGPSLLLPLVTPLAIAYVRGTKAWWSAARTALVTACVAYILLNVAYAPQTWVQRMRFWLSGDGIAGDVWGAGGRLHHLGVGLLDNFGPGGAVIGVLALLQVRPRDILLAVPLIGALLGSAFISYGGDRFYVLIPLASTPLIALGLSRWFALASRRMNLTWLAIALLLCINLLAAGLAWHQLASNDERLIERDALAHVPRNQTVAYLSQWRLWKGSTRLEWLGYDVEESPVQLWSTRPLADRPRWLYTTQGELAFIDDAARYPARAAMMQRESGSDLANWRGPEALGYHLRRDVRPALPPWYPLGWMPAARESEWKQTVLVYERQDATPITVTAPVGR